ncbi:2-amino-4-hydroxy-6-hydroxymethyldihydropteridine diphosphokinase [Iodobacter sp. HSC-16F04]|uniref:2-amino-4-hydroxy-6-hydroxymethyldihydropteridine pyrophosphokinase n=1 Tax=Iodobacter violaceini TaxID=3044271 RepID=A0ABX0KUE4_9NEIS|nr:2-amino-4-hydroxy-6-hydroxymethyldihydropteridine diphosphokinase [Iodobacter violacea]NHQ85767.1 2-amino-4-hydroxy-6-hydroxymethyldihydropteridine diphosphokinase [Iodobacter violacea]
MSTVAFIALGANLGQPVLQLQHALNLLAKLPNSQLLQQSGFYSSSAIGYTDQPDFINAVARLETSLSAAALLQAMLAIEAECGRQRTFQDAPRTLDLDLLLYGDEQIRQDHLIVPHPRMHQRAFVLRPLTEIAPEVIIPGLGAAKDFLPSVADQALSVLAAE